MTARIEAEDGKFLQLWIFGYQFSLDKVDDVHDANWLRVQVTANDCVRTWTSIAPALLTWEVEEIADWCRRVARDEPVEPWEGTEPNLGFEGVPSGDEDDRRALTISYALEFDPRPERQDDEPLGYGVDMLVSSDVLESFAGQLDTDLRSYPLREMGEREQS